MKSFIFVLLNFFVTGVFVFVFAHIDLRWNVSKPALFQVFIMRMKINKLGIILIYLESYKIIINGPNFSSLAVTNQALYETDSVSFVCVWGGGDITGYNLFAFEYWLSLSLRKCFERRLHQ